MKRTSMNGRLCADPTNAVDPAFTLLHLRLVPFQIVVDDVPALLLKVDAFLSDAADEK
jgi:hypothetical protein